MAVYHINLVKKYDERSPRLTPDKKWLKEKTMSAATVIWVDLLSFASSSVGTFLERLSEVSTGKYGV